MGLGFKGVFGHGVDLGGGSVFACVQRANIKVDLLGFPVFCIRWSDGILMYFVQWLRCCLLTFGAFCSTMWVYIDAYIF